MQLPIHLHAFPFPRIEKQVFYLCTDGFQDQFGGKENRKFMVKNLKNLFVNIHLLPFDEQKQVLNQTLADWKGEQKQIDDILIIGLKIIF